MTTRNLSSQSRETHPLNGSEYQIVLNVRHTLYLFVHKYSMVIFHPKQTILIYTENLLKQGTVLFVHLSKTEGGTSKELLYLHFSPHHSTETFRAVAAAEFHQPYPYLLQHYASSGVSVTFTGTTPVLILYLLNSFFFCDCDDDHRGKVILTLHYLLFILQNHSCSAELLQILCASFSCSHFVILVFLFSFLQHSKLREKF